MKMHMKCKREVTVEVGLDEFDEEDLLKYALEVLTNWLDLGIDDDLMAAFRQLFYDEADEDPPMLSTAATIRSDKDLDKHLRNQSLFKRLRDVEGGR